MKNKLKVEVENPGGEDEDDKISLFSFPLVKKLKQERDELKLKAQEGEEKARKIEELSGELNSSKEECEGLKWKLRWSKVLIELLDKTNEKQSLQMELVRREVKVGMEAMGKTPPDEGKSLSSQVGEVMKAVEEMARDKKELDAMFATIGNIINFTASR